MSMTKTLLIVTLEDQSAFFPRPRDRGRGRRTGGKQKDPSSQEGGIIEKAGQREQSDTPPCPPLIYRYL